jgi:hypothetical protein
VVRLIIDDALDIEREVRVFRLRMPDKEVFSPGGQATINSVQEKEK